MGAEVALSGRYGGWHSTEYWLIYRPQMQRLFLRFAGA